MTVGDTSVGYIGLGDMGASMCERAVSSGVDLVVFDLDTAAVDRVAALGATAAGSTHEVAAATDVVSVCVPAAQHVMAVVSQLCEATERPATVLIHSTIHPDDIRAAAALGADHGFAIHDVCVAGGGGAAKQGELVLLVGGLDDLPASARSLLAVYGTCVIDAGPVGAGAALKIGINVMTYAQQAAATAAFEIVETQGASTEALLEAWRHNGQLPPTLEQFTGLLGMGREHIVDDFHAYLSRVVQIAEKDLDLASTLGEGTPRGPSPVVAAIRGHMPAIFRVD